MVCTARTSSAVKKYKLKETVKQKRKQPNIIYNPLQMPFKFEDHIIKECNKVGKSRGSSRSCNDNKHTKEKYKLKIIKDKKGRKLNYIKYKNIWFNKWQLIGKVITIKKEKLKIISRY